MDSRSLVICLLISMISVKNCSGQEDGENDRIFGFLRVAKKCNNDANPGQCIKRNIEAWCEKRKDEIPEGTKISQVCGCINDNSRFIITSK